jgi:pilus assembly protein CpaE
MDRPSVLLALEGDSTPYVEALNRAGFLAGAVAAGTDAALFAGDDVPQLAVLDCDLPPHQVSALYAALRNGVAVPTILLVGHHTELPPGVGGAGSHDEVALKPVPPEAMVYRLQALMIRSGRHLPAESGAWATSDALSTAPMAGEGHVVSVFAPKGGVGKTTVAVNVAVALRQQTRSEVLLYDADVGVGNVTAVLEVPFRLGLADLADSGPEEWTDAAFEQLISVHAPSGVRVLTWGTDPAESERITVDLLLAALRWGRDHHSYVVIDNHPGYDDRTMAMLAVSNQIFLVLTPEMGALRNSSQFLELARELGLGSVVKVVVNRANHGIRLKDMESALGLPIAATVVSSGPKAVTAMNEGKPLVLKYPREPVANDLHRVARLATQPEAAAPAKPAARPWWARIGVRTSQA